jgi:imidazoleglycerol-phosphate dehydratase
MSRRADVARNTGETNIRVSLSLEGDGLGARTTGVGFFDHMLDSLAKHAGLDLELTADGDLKTGAHHTVEDAGICFGKALDEALGDRSGITRFGWAMVPMDEARATAAIDISGRPYTAFEADLPSVCVGGFESDLCEEFFRGVANSAKITLHLRLEAGRNPHHMIEVLFKAFACALREAVSLHRSRDGIPSTKGVL